MNYNIEAAEFEINRLRDWCAAYRNDIANIRRQLAEAKVELAKKEWRPISEAPKDGGHILLVYGLDIFQGFHDGDTWVDSMCAEEVRPTHFMPLPEPPK